MSITFPKAEEVDILLLLEGTYPYVSGGVSSWVYQIMNAYPQYKFGGLFIGSNRDEYSSLQYELPENLVHFGHCYLFDGLDKPFKKIHHLSKDCIHRVGKVHDAFKMPEDKELDHCIFDPEFYSDRKNGVTYAQFLYSENAWKFIVDRYEKYSTDPSFIDYFWVVRNMHIPLWKLANIAKQLPKAHLYHSPSTGYAGFLGAMLSHYTKKPLLISEHGIYTKERRIDLLQSHLTQTQTITLTPLHFEDSYLQNLWIRFFVDLGKHSYNAASKIISLYEDARKHQIIDGASPSKTQVIPNGIDIEKFRHLRRTPDKDVPPVACLLGRVVSIKDIKTFVRSMHYVLNKLPEAEAWIVGPLEEDKDYVVECIKYVEHLGLSQQIKFKGLKKTEEILPEVGVLVLSSISEGLPLSVIEGFAAGIPSVTTNVGSCYQLIHGIGDEDTALGAAGAVVGIADPQAMSDEIIKLLTDKSHWLKAQQAAIARVEKYYNQELMIDAYGKLYQEVME